MASARLRRREKQYDDLARENARLHRDVEDLETAFFLHRQAVEEEENSVRGMIRKEVGGSRWQHGGIGKLTTYKSSKDLKDSVVNQLNGSLKSRKAGSPATKSRNRSRDADCQANGKPAESDANIALRNEISNTFDGNTKTLASDLHDDENHIGVGNADGGKLLDLKTKVLKKASSKIIRRDTWHSPIRETDKPHTAEIESLSSSPGKVSKDSWIDSPGKRKQKPSTVAKKKSDSFKENKKLSRNDDRSNVVSSYHTVGKHLDKNDMKNGTDVKRIDDKTFGTRQSRRDMHISGSKTFITEVDERKVLNNHTNSGDKNLVGLEKGALNSSDANLAVKNKQHEATEIFVNPNTSEVRIKSLGNRTLNGSSEIERTKVFIQDDLKASAETPESFNFSIIDKDKSTPNRNDIRDVFGLLDSIQDTRSVLPHGVKKTISSLSPSALAKDCDTEVEFWLRGLCLKDVEKYVEMFAENDIDLLDLEFMSAAQLHDMGVEDSEAFSILLNGVRELRNLPPDKGSKQEDTGPKRGLQAASIAWEEPSTDRRKVKQADQKQSDKKAGKIGSPVTPKNRTFTIANIEKLKFDDKNRAETNSNRNNSAMSNYSDCNLERVDSFRDPKRKQNSHTNAQPKASNNNIYSQYERVSSRPASAKSNKPPPNSKPQVQKKTASMPNKKGKSKDQATDGQSRLQSLEARPARSVLLKRSASLTRESGRGQNRKATDQEENQNKKAPVRTRSRSAEAVRRKALEGVQAAAMKNERRQIKDRENEETKSRLQERKKVERDEMAARHLQREKSKTPGVAGRDTSKEIPVSASIGNDPDLGSLVTVNTFSQPEKQETVGKSLEVEEEERSRTRVIAPVVQARKSVRKTEPGKKSTGKVTPQAEYEVPVLSTYKLETRKKEGALSEPESGYKTDTSATYSQVEEKVVDIQRKIKRLKSQALAGDEVTLTLVKDLQTELQHFEKLLTEKEKVQGGEKQEKHAETSKEQTPYNEPGEVQKPTHPDNDPPTPQPSLMVPAVPHKVSPRQENAIEDILLEDSVVKGEGLGASLSKKELLDEMRKEKHQHHRQIRQLQSELKRMRETDAASSMELTQEDIVYREEDIIGEGAFSNVFRGTYQGAEVAVKRLIVPLAPQDRNYFAAEVSLLRELRHPHVVLLIGVCTSDKLPLMVIEYMSGGSLFYHLHDENNMSLDHAEYYQVARDIALGMNYLHSHKPEVLHLDLKSMNVLLCQSFRAKIADFGFSKLRHDSSARVAKGKGKAGPTQRGSPAWMSPELIDKGETTCKADVYSYAVVLWEMLTRQIPFENYSVFQVLEMVRKNKRPEIPSSCPEGLKLFISRCWDQNPAKRPHFKEVVSVLENLAFPPAWRQLFKKAGVSDEALHNIESTRTLIHLVRTTLDSKSFSSFMIADPKALNDSSGETTLDTSRDTTASTCILVRKTTLIDTGDCESGSISDVSEIPTAKNSEFSLGTLRSSSDENDSDSLGETIMGNYADDSSDYSSGDDSIVLPVSSERKTPRKKLNVFVPGLELSVKSPDAKTSRDQKAQFDWMSISLEDRTYRDKVNHSPDREVTRLNLSNRSNRIVAPLSPVAVSTARETEQKSWQEKAKEMDEYLMRESINNRRPSSPIRKRLSLTKKLAGRTVKSLDTEYNGRSAVDELEEDEDIDEKRRAFTERSAKTGLDNTNDLASLNRKLADLNAKYENFDKRLTNLSQNNNQKLRQLVEEVFDSERLTVSGGSHRSYVEDQSNIDSDRNNKRSDLFNDKSYDSFYSLPIHNLPRETSAYRRSDTTLPRCDSFTKSRDLLDLLTTQIGQTTKTLDDIENESESARSDTQVYRQDVHQEAENLLSPSKTVKQFNDNVISEIATTAKSDEFFTKNINKASDIKRTSKTYMSVPNEKSDFFTGGITNVDEKKTAVSARYPNEQDLKEFASIRSVAEHYKSRHVFPGRNVIEVDESTKEGIRQKHLDDYREFVKKEILHDAGGSIENLKSLNYKSDEQESDNDKSQHVDTELDESNETVTQVDEQTVEDLSAKKNQNNDDSSMIEPSNDKSSSMIAPFKNETGVSKIAKVNKSVKTDIEKDAKAEKESIRVVLNPSVIVGRKPIRTPRKSKMKEIPDVTIVNSARVSNDTKSSVDIGKSEADMKSHSPDIVSKEDAVRQLQDLEDFSEIQSESTEITEMNTTESKQLQSDQSKEWGKLVEDNTPTAKTVNVDKVLKNCTSEGTADELSNSEKSDKSQKVKLIPKQEQWKKSPEKPKTTAYVLKHPLSKGKRNSPEGNNISPTSEMKPKQRNAVSKAKPADYPEIPKKTIRVKLKKDPLAPVLSEGPQSPVPPAPPPPPIDSLSMSTVTFSKSVQVPKTAASMADELKLRVASWQSRSYQRNFVKPKHEHVGHKHVSQSLRHAVLSMGPLDSVVEDQSVNMEDSLDDIEVCDDQNKPQRHKILIPKLSDGVPNFAVQSLELRDQKDHLRSISKPHPGQLEDLSHVSQEQLLSIAELLRKAVMERRLALGEDSASVDQSIDSVSWSVETTPRP